jgi:hypothetical protein
MDIRQLWMLGSGLASIVMGWRAANVVLADARHQAAPTTVIAFGWLCVALMVAGGAALAGYALLA